MYIFMSWLQNMFIINDTHEDFFLFVKVFKMQNIVVGYETHLTEVTDEYLKIRFVCYANNLTCKVSSAHHCHLWSSLMIQSSTVQTPTRRASLPASLAQELGPQSCFQERRTLAPVWWGLPLCTSPQSVCHTCCSSHLEPVTEDTQVSLFILKVQICIISACCYILPECW